MSNQIQNVFWENRRRYGSRRIQKALQEQSIDVGRHQVRRLMQLQDWRAIQRQRPTVAQFRATHHRFTPWLTSLP